GVHVNDVRADGDVHSDGDPEARAGGQYADAGVGKVGTQQGAADGGPESFIAPRGGDGAVEKPTSLRGHAEAPVGQVGGDVLRRGAGVCQLEVVDDCRTVHRHRVEDAALHEINDQRAQADLDGMRTHTEHDALAGAVPCRDRLGYGAQVARGE